MTNALAVQGLKMQKRRVRTSKFTRINHVNISMAHSRGKEDGTRIYMQAHGIRNLTMHNETSFVSINVQYNQLSRDCMLNHLSLLQVASTQVRGWLSWAEHKTGSNR